MLSLILCQYFDVDDWMPIKEIAPIVAQVIGYAHYGPGILFPNSTCSPHTQFGRVWKFIAQAPKAVSKYPFQNIRNICMTTELDLNDCKLEGKF
jgi:hypothetical protein